MNTGSGNIKRMHNHSTAENNGGQLSSQNGIEAMSKTATQTTESIVNTRALGLPTNWH
jgi:hypothetical protein